MGESGQGSTKHTMKVLLLLMVWVALGQAMEGSMEGMEGMEGMEEEPGVVFSPDEVRYFCTKGTRIQAKMAEAVKKCASPEVADELAKEEAFEKELEAEEAAKETALSGNGTFNSGNLGTPEGSDIQFAMDTDFKTVNSTYVQVREFNETSVRMLTSFIGGVTVDMRSAGRTKVVDDRQKGISESRVSNRISIRKIAKMFIRLFERKPKKKPKKKPSKKKPSKKKPKKKPGKKPGKKPTKPSGNKPTTFPPRAVFVSCEASCATMDDISLSMMEKMNTEVCVMQAVGWLDNEGKPIKDVMEKDIKDFPESVAAALSEDQITVCAEHIAVKKMEMMQNSSEFQAKHGACFENECYNEEEKNNMSELMIAGAKFKCFEHMLTEACAPHVKNQLMDCMMPSTPVRR